MAAPVTRDQELELTIDSLAFGGNGVARLDGFVLGFEASGYPERPTPVVTAFRVLPHAEAAPSPTA